MSTGNTMTDSRLNDPELRNSQKIPLIAITGPTAAGKTQLAIDLSKEFPIELINMDSAQIYRDMDIGTAKISDQEQQLYPHHLMNILSPEQSYSVAQFVEDVTLLVAKIHARGNIPLVVGGTILYYKALTDGLADLPAANEDLRQELRATIVQHGYQYLLHELAASDPLLAAKIQGKDSQRLIRFVEILRLSGRTPSELFAEQKQQQETSVFNHFHISFFPEDRAWLHHRIEQRFDDMLSAGLVDEVKSLQKKYELESDMSSMRCAGYRQVWDYLDGVYDDMPPSKNNKSSNTPYEEMRNRGVFATRQLAKRQLTWLRKTSPDVVIQDPENYDYEAIKKSLALSLFPN